MYLLNNFKVKKFKLKQYQILAVAKFSIFHKFRLIIDFRRKIIRNFCYFQFYFQGTFAIAINLYLTVDTCTTCT